MWTVFKNNNKKHFKNWCFTRDSKNVLCRAYLPYEFTLKIVDCITCSFIRSLFRLAHQYQMPVLEWVTILWSEFFADLLVRELQMKHHQLTINHTKTLTLEPLPFWNYVLRIRDHS
jgi:hypothetical protein